MGESSRRLRGSRVFLATTAGALLIAGAVVAFGKLDPDRHRSDPGRLERLAAAVLPSPAAAGAGEWPGWRGPNRDGLSLETGLRTDFTAGGPRVLWRQAVGRGFSCVAVSGGRLYTMEQEEGPAGTHEAVACLDALTGRVVWRFRYANHYEERFGSGPRSTPAVDGNRVYAVGPTGIFHCLRADTGVKLWRHDLAEEFAAPKMRYGVAFSPLVEGDLVYTTPGGPGGNAVAAFDKRSGTLVWKALDDPMGYSSPLAVTAAGVRQLLVFTNTALVSLCPADGRLHWRHPWVTEGGFNIATPVAFGDYVFISSAYGKGCALLEVGPESDGSLRPQTVYEHNRMRNHFASSVRHGEHVYGFDMTDLVCMNLRTGVVAWRQNGSRSFRKGSLVIAGGNLFVLGEDGTLTVAEATPAAYKPKASVRVSANKCWTPPVVAGGRLYVRDEGQIVCLDLRP
jgi:outer membrane protein assembly factor BamB